MKSQWVMHKLNSYLPCCTNSLLSPFKTQIHGFPTSPQTSAFLLNHVDTSLLLSLCGREGLLCLTSSLHASIVKNPEFYNSGRHSSRHALVIWNSLLSAYVKCGALGNAVKVFDELPMRDTVSWNTMVSGFLRDGEIWVGFGFFKRMRELGCGWSDQASLTTVLSGFQSPELGYASKMIHCLALLSGFEKEVTVGNALITAYFKCGCCASGRQVFDEMFERNVISWTAVLSGLAQNEMYVDSLILFVEMLRGCVEPNFLTYLNPLMACAGLQALKEGCQIHGLVLKLGIQSDMCIESSLMDMYSKCGSVEDAWRIFESASVLDEVSVTTMLVGLAQNEFEEEAIQIFLKAWKLRIEIDVNMVSAILGVFGVDTSMGFGKQIHALVIKRRFGSNPFVGNGLINMYSKCGDLEDSIKVFHRMPNRNSVTWNSMIAAFARHGHGLKALELYEEMRVNGAEPTDVTFISLLHACGHMGLVDKGMELLKFMTEFHGLRPRSEHYACVVDMLGRAGMLKEAKAFIEELPVEPDALVWQALLGACGIHEDTETGKYAANQLFLSAPESAAPYILLANIYSSKGKWKERAMTIKRMKEMGATKETGISWIEIEKNVHSFVVADKKHPQAEIIYGVLKELLRLMIDEGYVPDTRFILYYLDRDGTR